MRFVLITLATAITLMLVWFIFLAYKSQTAPPPVRVDEGLAPCQRSSNCVSSSGAAAGVEVITYKGTTEQAWQAMRQTIEALGGTIEQQQGDYLWATFRTPLFRYVDDVELLLEPLQQQFQIRSASRVGRSDFNANRARVAAIRDAFFRADRTAEARGGPQ